MTKDEFYRGKVVVSTEWYLQPDLRETPTWARLRVFDDGTADACFDEGDTLHAFDQRDYASYILTEDEYQNFSAMDAEDEAALGIRLSELTPPTWADRPDQAFKYWGTY
jgi:hypothetical protein